MPTQPFSVGDRVVYRDPENPRNPLAGEVVDVTEHADAVTPVPLVRDYWLPGAGS